MVWHEELLERDVLPDWAVRAGIRASRTAEAWLSNLDRDRQRVLDVLRAACGAAEAPRRLAAWRVFFMACVELWGFRGGHEWLVSHYLFERR